MRKIFVLSTLSLFLFSTCKKQEVIIAPPEIITPKDSVVPLQTLSGDSIIFYGASIELGQNGGTRWPLKVSQILGLKEVNKAISGTSFQRRVANDNSFVFRLSSVKNYSPSTALIVIGASNILNDHSWHLGYSKLPSEIKRVVDTLHINKGYPLSRIVIVTPGVIGHANNFFAPMSNDSLVNYSNAAIEGAKKAGVPYIDNFTYTKDNGGYLLVSSDSIHPNALGQQRLAEGFTKALHKYFKFD